MHNDRYEVQSSPIDIASDGMSALPQSTSVNEEHKLQYVLTRSNTVYNSTATATTTATTTTTLVVRVDAVLLSHYKFYKCSIECCEN
jgi:hypothetical protein